MSGLTNKKVSADVGLYDETLVLCIRISSFVNFKCRNWQFREKYELSRLYRRIMVFYLSLTPFDKGSSVGLLKMGNGKIIK